jgi:hypothetical protein
MGARPHRIDIETAPQATAQSGALTEEFAQQKQEVLDS